MGSEFEEVSRVLIGFPNTEGLPEEEARSTIQKYWDDRKEQNVEWRDKNYIPKDLSRYPGFPQTESLPKEEVDELVKNFWKQYNEKRTVFPAGFWTEPTALMPKDTCCRCRPVPSSWTRRPHCFEKRLTLKRSHGKLVQAFFAFFAAFMAFFMAFLAGLAAAGAAAFFIAFFMAFMAPAFFIALAIAFEGKKENTKNTQPTA